LNATLTLHGKAAHSARPWVGENPVYKVNEVVKLVQDNEITELDIDGLQFKQVMSITKISSGIANNVIPEDLKLNLNFRYSPEINGETASEYIRDLFSNHSDVDIVNTSDGAMPNMVESEINYFIEKTGAVVQPKQAWTDIARFYQNNIPCLNFGPGDPLLAHATNEHISKRQLLESYELLSNYFKDKSE
jgi:succinyl-diaminopimelate desuccinylase